MNRAGAEFLWLISIACLCGCSSPAFVPAAAPPGPAIKVATDACLIPAQPDQPIESPTSSNWLFVAVDGASVDCGRIANLEFTDLIPTEVGFEIGEAQIARAIESIRAARAWLRKCAEAPGSCDLPVSDKVLDPDDLPVTPSFVGMSHDATTLEYSAPDYLNSDLVEVVVRDLPSGDRKIEVYHSVIDVVPRAR